MAAASSSTMTLRGRAGVYAAAALLRLFLTLAFPGLPDLLTGRVEISTPVTSFKRRAPPVQSPAHEDARHEDARLTAAADTCSARGPISLQPQCLAV